MGSLAELRARVAGARAAGGRELVAALVDLAEAEPALRHRGAPIRALLEEAAAALDRADEPALQGRVLVRLAAIKMAEEDLEGAEQLLDRAFDLLRAAAASDRLVEAGALTCRVQIRRRRLDGVDAMLGRLGGALGDRAEDPAARRAAVALGLALGEAALEAQDNEKAIEIMNELVAGLTVEEGFGDALFAGHQILALARLAVGEADRACHDLRALVALARGLGATADEAEARVALAGALGERGDRVALEEAERHLQVARDLSLENRFDSTYMTALVGQAGLMARRGQTQGALDRCLELGRAAADRGDLRGYVAAVALLSQIYRRQGDFPSAYRALAEAEVALAKQLGENAKDLVRPHVLALVEEMGRNKFLAMVDNMGRARQALDRFGRDEP